MTCLAEPVGEGVDPVGEALGVVEEEDVGHAGTLATATDVGAPGRQPITPTIAAQ